MKMEFTKRFNEILNNSKVKQCDIAKYCNITRQSVSDFKKGKSYPSIQTLYQICIYLDISSDYLLGLTDI